MRETLIRRGLTNDLGTVETEEPSLSDAEESSDADDFFPEDLKVKKEIAKLVENLTSLSGAEDPDFLPEIVILEDVTRWAREQQVRQKGAPLPLSPVVIAEPGGKTRLATKHPAWANVLGKGLSVTLLSGLKKSSSVGGSMEGTYAENLDVPVGSEQLSADLTAASDFIPHEVAEALIRGIGKALKWDHADLELALMLVGPMQWVGERGQRLYPGEDKITTRGVCMGLPMAWPLLCLLNMFAAERILSANAYKGRGAFAPACFGRKGKPTTMWEDHRTLADEIVKTGLRLYGPYKLSKKYAVVGDDLLLTCPRGYAKVAKRMYEQIMTALGLEVNKTKSFAGPRGVFCEHLVVPGKGAVPILKMSQVMQSRMMDPAGRIIEDRAPLTHVLGPAMQQLQSHRNFPIIKAAMLRSNAKTIRKLRKSGIPLNAPQWCGGAGIPGSEDCPAKLRLAVATALRLGVTPSGATQGNFPVKWTGQKNWNIFQKQILAEVNSVPASKEGVPFGDALNETVTLLNRQRLLLNGENTTGKYLTAGQIAAVNRRNWRELGKEACKAARSLNPVTKGKLWDPRLAAKLDSKRVPVGTIREILLPLAPVPRNLAGDFYVRPAHEALPLGHRKIGSSIRKSTQSSN